MVTTSTSSTSGRRVVPARPPPPQRADTGSVVGRAGGSPSLTRAEAEEDCAVVPAGDGTVKVGLGGNTVTPTAGGGGTDMSVTPEEVPASGGGSGAVGVVGADEMQEGKSMGEEQNNDDLTLGAAAEIVESLTVSIGSHAKREDPARKEAAWFYTIDVSSPVLPAWEVEHRFSEFVALHKQLLRDLPLLPDLPDKDRLLVNRSQRQGHLDVWLREALHEAVAAGIDGPLLELAGFLAVGPRLRAADNTYLADSKLPLRYHRSPRADGLRVALAHYEAYTDPGLVAQMHDFACSPAGAIYINGKPRDFARYGEHEQGRSSESSEVLAATVLFTQNFTCCYARLAEDGLSLCYYESREAAQASESAAAAQAKATVADAQKPKPAARGMGLLGRALSVVKEKSGQAVDAAKVAMAQSALEKTVGKHNAGTLSTPGVQGIVNLGMLCDVRLSNLRDAQTKASLDLVFVHNVVTLSFEDAQDDDGRWIAPEHNQMRWAKVLLDLLPRAQSWRQGSGRDVWDPAESRVSVALKRVTAIGRSVGRGSARLSMSAIALFSATSPWHKLVMSGNLADMLAYCAAQNEKGVKFLPPEDQWGQKQDPSWGVFERDRIGSTAFHYAVIARKGEEVLDWLQRVGFDVDDYNVSFTPLMLAAANLDVATVEWLLRHGADAGKVSIKEVFPIVQPFAWYPENLARRSVGRNRDLVVKTLQEARFNPRAYSERFHVFINYRVISNAYEAEQLRLRLLDGGRVGPDKPAVYLDKVELVAGEQWDSGFCSALTKSQIFCPIVSRGALSKMAPLMAQDALHGTRQDWCDNVLLEYQLALVLLAAGKIRSVQPIFVGEVDSRGCLPLDVDTLLAALAPVPSAATLAGLEAQLTRMNISSMLTDTHRDMTVRGIASAICSFPAIHLDRLGRPGEARQAACSEVLDIIQEGRRSTAKAKSGLEWADVVVSSLPPADAAPVAVTTTGEKSECGPCDGSKGAAAIGEAATQDRAERLQTLLAALATECADSERTEHDLYLDLARQVCARLQVSEGERGVLADADMAEEMSTKLDDSRMADGSPPVVLHGFGSTLKRQYLLYQLFVPIISQAVVAHLEARAPGATIPSSLLRDWEVALELAHADDKDAAGNVRLLRVVPVLVGDADARSYLSYFDLFGGRPVATRLPTHICTASKAAAAAILEAHGVTPGPAFAGRTIRGIYQALMRFQGIDLHRVSQYNSTITAAAHKTMALAQSLYDEEARPAAAKRSRTSRQSILSTSSSAAQDPLGSMRFQKTSSEDEDGMVEVLDFQK